MNINEHTGKEMRTGWASKDYVTGWERIFGKINTDIKENVSEENNDNSGHTNQAGSADGTSDMVGEVHLRPTP